MKTIFTYQNAHAHGFCDGSEREILNGSVIPLAIQLKRTQFTTQNPNVNFIIHKENTLFIDTAEWSPQPIPPHHRNIEEKGNKKKVKPIIAIRTRTHRRLLDTKWSPARLVQQYGKYTSLYYYCNMSE